PAADDHREAALDPVARVARLGDAADIVEPREPARFVGAARERHLELATEVLRLRMAEQEVRHGAGVRRDVEHLVVAHAGDVARGDVAHRVPAGFASRDAHLGEAPHQRGRVLEMDVVELHVLPRRDVQDVIGVLLGEIADRLELPRRDAAAGDLDALHPRRIPQRTGPFGEVRIEAEGLRVATIVPKAVVVTLTIGTTTQTRFGEDLVVQASLAFERELARVDVDLLGPILAGLLAEPDMARVRRGVGRGVLVTRASWLHGHLSSNRRTGRNSQGPWFCASM